MFWHYFRSSRIKIDWLKRGENVIFFKLNVCLFIFWMNGFLGGLVFGEKPTIILTQRRYIGHLHADWIDWDMQFPRLKMTVLGISDQIHFHSMARCISKVWWPHKIVTGWCKVAIFAGRCNILKVFPIRIDPKNCGKKIVIQLKRQYFKIICTCACLRFGWMDSFHCLLGQCSVSR